MPKVTARVASVGEDAEEIRVTLEVDSQEVATVHGLARVIADSDNDAYVLMGYTADNTLTLVAHVDKITLTNRLGTLHAPPCEVIV